MKCADEWSARVPPMSLSDVSDLLWRERRILETLLFKLEEERLILAAGRTRWLVHATREVEMVLDEIKHIELERAVVLDDVSANLGLGDASTLDALASSTTAPWPQIFDDHRAALLELTREICTAADANRGLLARGHNATRAALDALSTGCIPVDLVEEATRP